MASGELVVLPLPRFDPAPFCLGSSNRLFCGFQQIERLTIEFAVPAGRQQVVVQRGDRGLRETGDQGHLRVLEGELGRECNLVLALQREHLAHHLVRRAMVVAGQQPVDPDQASVNQNLRGKFAGSGSGRRG